MQIRLTVVDPLGPSPQRGRAASRDVLVTAPVGTDLAAVASALAAAVTGEGGAGRDSGGAPVVLYAGTERLDARRRTLGEPPLVDGAVLSLGAPAALEPHPELDDAPTQLHVIAGPDAGGVHLLHGGRITVGRSADADVPLDDLDVSRLHCAVTVAPDGHVTVTDLGSTNGTTLDGTRVTDRPLRFPPGALLRIGESALRVTPSGGPAARVRTVPDGEGYVRVPLGVEGAGDAGVPGTAAGPGGDSAPGAANPAAYARAGRVDSAPDTAYGARAGSAPAAASGSLDGPTHHAYGTGAWGPADAGAHEHRRGERPAVPGQAGAPGIESHGPGAGSPGRAAGTGAGTASADRTTSGYGAGEPGGGPWAAGDRGPAAAAGARLYDRRGQGSAGRSADAGHPAPGTPGTPDDGAWPRAAAASGTGTGHADAGLPHAPHAPRTPDDEAWGRGTPGPAGQVTGRNPTDADLYGTGTSGAAARPYRVPGSDSGSASASASGGYPEAGRPGSRGLDGGAWSAHDTHAGRQGVGGDGGTAEGGHPGTTTHDALPDEGTRAGGRKGTPVRGTDVPPGARRRGGLGAWARRLAGGRAGQPPAGPDAYAETAKTPGTPAPGVPQRPDTWPDPAALLLTALGPGPRLWERGQGHPEALTVRLGTADRTAPDGSGPLPAVPVTAALREAGALGLAGPRPRLSGLARAVLAQLAALHSPDLLEIVLISADRSRPVEERTAEWSWLGWLPHVRPGRGQDCRLLLAYDREQAAARVEELLRRVEDHAAAGLGAARPSPARTAPVSRSPYASPSSSPASGSSSPASGSSRSAESFPGPVTAAHRPSWVREGAEPSGIGGFPGPYTVVVLDGDPGGAGLREALARLAVAGPRAGVHVVCLAETTATLPTPAPSAASPAASGASPAPPSASASPDPSVTEAYEAACAVTPTFRHCGAVALLGGDVASVLHLMRVAPTGPVGTGTLAAVDAVSAAWAERFARALAPLRPDGPGERHARATVPLPLSARLLEELGLARATPASLMARWADAADDTESLGGRARTVLGAGARGPLTADLVADGPHLLIEGPAGSGRTELLRALVASLAAAERPDRLSIVLIDGRDGVGTGAGRGEGLRVCTDIPHVTTHLIANDPVRMREFAQSLSAELKRRTELVGLTDFAQWHAGREVSGRIVAQRSPGGRPAVPGSASGGGNGDIDAPPSSTLRLRPRAAARQHTEAAPPLPRLVVVVDDLDALVSPALGSTGRPAAGSVMRALEAVAREGERLGVHLVAAAGTGGRTAETEPARQATLRVTLDAPSPGPEEPAPGRGVLTHPDGRTVGFQGGRVTGRIPRTATQRPTVLALEWERTGDPPARRPVRELGNGPTDLALLASAVQRAAREVSAAEVPSLL
ncbi:FtsK/SpoIIIE domain-containing protein [Streptomyces sp. NBC_00820]|uniref:FHA domain-containing protein n=1 Tax=Streptomyces sp. NBC_00820 TaxID=2975842 RepID=UPI002ED0E075|nr:FtsK/SpoIIIE domain-containing protein [Streptomyces sp. NBC_00820]